MNGLPLPVGALGTKGAGGANALTPGLNGGVSGREIDDVGRAIGATGARLRGFKIEGTADANGDLMSDGVCSAGCTGVNFATDGKTEVTDFGAVTTVLMTVVVVASLADVGGVVFVVVVVTFVLAVGVVEPACPVGATGAVAPK